MKRGQKTTSTLDEQASGSEKLCRITRDGDSAQMLSKLLNKIKRGTHPTKDDGTLDLPPAEVCSLALLKKPDEQVPATWKNIDVYPPMAKAIPAEPLDGILYRNRQRILDISETLGLSDEDFDGLVMPVIRNFASFVHLLPSSENHHHRGAGGALRHSLEVSFWSARAAEDIIFCRNSDPKERRRIEPLWRVATCVAGLLHDAGKPIADLTVTDANGEMWHPLEQPLYEFLRAKKREGYYLSWRGGRYKRHEAFTQRAFDKIVPSSFISHLMAHDPNIVFAINEAFYGMDDSNHIAKVVNWADQESVRRDALEDVERKTGGDFDYGLPVHRHVFNSIRRLMQNGNWKVNQPGAKIWHSDQGTFVVFKHGLNDIISDIKKEVGVTIRNDPDGLVDEFIQRGLVKPRYVPGGEPQSEDDLGDYYLYWVITPKVLENANGGDHIKLTAIKLDSPERLFRNEIPAAADINVWSTQELGGGFQPEFGSSRNVQVIQNDHVNTSTGEVLTEGQSDIAASGQATVDDSIDSVGTVGQDTPQDAGNDNAVGAQSNGDSKDAAAQSHGTETENPDKHSNDPEPLRSKSPEDDPKQQLLQRAKKGFASGAKSNKENQLNTKVQEPSSTDDHPEHNEKQSGSTPDISSILSSIDEDMEMPFGLSASSAPDQKGEGSDGASAAKLTESENPDESAADGKEVGVAENREVSSVSSAKSTNDHSDEPGDTKKSLRQENVQAQIKEPKSAPSPKKAAPNPLLDAGKTRTSRKQINPEAPVKKLGKYQKVTTKPSDASGLLKTSTSDPVQAFKQFVADNTATGAGQIIETLVETVIHKGEQLGRRWFLHKGSVAIAYPSAFDGITGSAADALARLDKARILKQNPKQPMSKVMEIDEVMSIVLDERTSNIVIRFLQEQEKSIDPLYVPPHPDLKVVRRSVAATPDRVTRKSPTKKASEGQKRIKASKKGNNSPSDAKVQCKNTAVQAEGNALSSSPDREERPARLDRIQEAETAMKLLVDQMIAGEGDLVDDMKEQDGEKRVPHSVVTLLKVRFPRLTVTLARQSFWKAAKAHGYEWQTNKGHFTLGVKEK